MITIEATAKEAQKFQRFIKPNTAIKIINLAIDVIDSRYRSLQCIYKIQLLETTRIVPIKDVSNFDTINPISISPINRLYSEEEVGPINVLGIVIKTEREKIQTSNRRSQNRETVTIADTTGTASFYCYGYNIIKTKSINDIIGIIGLKWNENYTNLICSGYILKNLDYPAYTETINELKEQDINNMEINQLGPKLRTYSIEDVNLMKRNMINENATFEVIATLINCQDFETAGYKKAYRLTLFFQDPSGRIKGYAWAEAAKYFTNKTYVDMKKMRDTDNTKFQALLENLANTRWKLQIILKRYREELQFTVIRAQRTGGVLDDFSLLII